jgi:hypothetical protein
MLVVVLLQLLMVIILELRLGRAYSIAASSTAWNFDPSNLLGILLLLLLVLIMMSLGMLGILLLQLII